jgi:hypothetical protein
MNEHQEEVQSEPAAGWGYRYGLREESLAALCAAVSREGGSGSGVFGDLGLCLRCSSGRFFGCTPLCNCRPELTLVQSQISSDTVGARSDLNVP